ncbi:helix-turn-helix domain-containing protein [Clostridium algidicarnis]|uniref:helix-turn-helix domain-containing protein n=1 Tax=Clostridium algidicarnis TaxID=37659 RepID=UPI001C0DC5BA|nr:helix-turn-helix domain-containing protein [Clostridium algidicarnis]MBU3195696.1 helix-turn-helix domain-containing protein [Clostridium algidicarnis]
MVNTRMIRAQMALHGYTINSLSKELGISAKTLSTRLNVSPENFTQMQIQKMITTLKIQEPMKIFFVQ